MKSTVIKINREFINTDVIFKHNIRFSLLNRTSFHHKRTLEQNIVSSVLLHIVLKNR